MRLHAASKETGIAGEQFAPLEVGQDKLSGVFVKDGTSLAFEVQEAQTAAICSCGLTKNPPYCDGSHVTIE